VNARGFTLIEMLIAVTLLAAMIAMLFGGVRTGIDGAARIERRLEAVDDLRTTQYLLRRLLGSAQPLAQVPGGRLIGFDGRADGIDFVAALPAALGGGLAEWRLRQDKSGRLEVLRTPLAGEGIDFDFADAEASLLLGKIKRLAIDYFGPDAEGKPAWSSTWREVDALPQLVRIRVEADSLLPWPELMIAPRIERGER
jgi:general secretion pathway protein J